MDSAKPEFFNDIFSRFFTKKLSEFKYTNIITGTQTFNELIQYLVLDYKFNRNAASTNVLLKRFDAILKEFLDHFGTQSVNEKEKKALTDMLQEVKKNPILAKVRSEGVVLNPPTIANKSAQNESNQAKQIPAQGIESQASKEEIKKEEEKKEKAAGGEGEEKPVEKLENQAHYVKRDPNEFVAMMNQLKDKFDDHKIEDAYEIREKILQWANEASPEDENKQLFAAKIQENKRLIEETELWHKEVQNILREMNEDEGYVLDTGPKTYTSKYKALPDGKAILKMEGPLKIPLFNILALMYEAEGFNHWVPFCSDAKLIKPLHRASHVYWLKYGLPPPLTSRECHCFGYGADRFDRNGSVLLLSRSIDFNEDFKNHYGITIPKETKYVRMDIDVATEFTPISKDEMMMRQVVLVDVKVKNTPPFILTWISRKTGQHMFETMIKKGKNLKGTMWEKGINNNKEFYGWLQNKVDKFLTEHELA